MKMIVERTYKVQVDFSADDWELYTSMEGVDEVAEALNRALEEAVASSVSARIAYQKVIPVMRNYSDFGAVDSEPINFLDEVLYRIYG
jgi:HD superfamily phosphohydrolase YqeK